MIKNMFVLLIFGFLFGSMTLKADDLKDLFAPSLKENDVVFMYLGYSGVIIRTSKGTVIIDPADLLKGKDLNALKEAGVSLIVFTHGHGDHYNPERTVELFEATEAPILAERSVANSLKGAIPPDKLTEALPGKDYAFKNVTVNAIKGTHVGAIILYRITIGGVGIFHGGDSGYVALGDYPSDIAFLPTGTPSPTASAQDAFKMASDLKPSVIVAMHGSASQSQELEGKVKESMPKTSVIVPEAYQVKIITLAK